MRLCLIAACLFSLVCLVQGQNPQLIKTDKIEGIICTNFADWSFDVSAKEFWTPTKKDVFTAEEQIEAYLKTDPHHPDILRKLPGYKRQYVGIIVDGHKRIFCRFYCWLPEPLSDQPIFVSDGGECYFRIQYDFVDKKCHDFWVNGSV